MKSFLFSIAFLFLVFFNVNSQTTGFKWAKGIVCTEEFSPSTIKTDSHGNIFISGRFSGQAEFKSGGNTITIQSQGYEDVFFLKSNSQGELIWIKTIKGKYNAACNGMVLDNHSNIYLTGRYTGKFDFDTGSDTYELDSNSGADIFIAKYDSTGAFLWAKRIGGDGLFNDADDEGTSIALDNENNLLITGWFQGTVDFNPGAGVHNLSTARVSCFILKLSAEGEFIWAEKINSPNGGVEGHTIKTDSKNNVYISGLFRAATDFNPGEGTYVLEPAENYAAFLVKLDKNANFRWAIQPGGYAINTNLDKKRPFEIDSEGNIILAFDFRNTVDFNPKDEETLLTSNGNFTDVFIQKLDSLGNLLWVKQIGGPDYDAFGALHVDENNNIYITGYYTGTVDFDPGNGTYELTAGNEWNIGLFIARYSPEGNLAWAHPINWVENDGTYSYGYGSGITTDVEGNIISVGKFNGKYNFNPHGVPSILSSADIDYSFSGYILKLDGIITSLTPVINELFLNYYPNPFSDKITITGNIQFKNAELWLRSIDGKTIVHKNNISGNNVEVRTGTIPAGIYFLEMRQEDTRFIGKVVKH